MRKFLCSLLVVLCFQSVGYSQSGLGISIVSFPSYGEVGDEFDLTLRVKNNSSSNYSGTIDLWKKVGGGSSFILKSMSGTSLAAGDSMDLEIDEYEITSAYYSSGHNNVLIWPTGGMITTDDTAQTGFFLINSSAFGFASYGVVGVPEGFTYTDEYDLEFIIKNFGSSDYSGQMYFQMCVDGGAPDTIMSVSRSINAGATRSFLLDDFEFSSDLFPPDPAGIKVQFYVTGSGLTMAMDTMEYEVYYDGPVGIDIRKNESIKLYPNPAKDRLHVDTGSLGITEWKIISLAGKVVSVGENFPLAGILLTDFFNGIYFLEVVTTDGEKIREKVLISR